ncbi:hypothetical protein B0I37DRAFT_366999 [Chaetomium sp. MPI-CAGE-AT-0009]|nr:hypothetical protein B0I37DRAFT_366999 [Chaetomium sp. MPI-CAGE-AT-0009]
MSATQLEHIHHSDKKETRHRHSPVWLPEILSQVCAVLCLFATLALLWFTDGKPPPSVLGQRLTLNTALAFLVSLAKVAFFVPLVEGLGQLKWMWYVPREHRPLIDLQVFDDATRGGLGSLRLLFSRKGFLASFGALIMLSGLFTSTLTQQAILYPLVQAVSHHPNATAVVYRTTNFSAYNGNTVAFAPFDAARGQQAIFQGFFSAPSTKIPVVNPVCSSGDCVWPLYGSLAACGDVANLTAVGNATLIGELNNMTEKRLGLLLNTSTVLSLGYKGPDFQSVSNVFPIVIGLLDEPTGTFNQSVTDLIFSDAFVAYTDEPMNNSVPFDSSKIKYLEVAFWWCTKTFSTRVTAGNSTTVEISTRSQLKAPSRTLNMPWATDFSRCYRMGTCNENYGGDEAQLEPPPGADGPDGNYTVHLWSELLMSGLFASTITDSVLVNPRLGVVFSGGGVAKAFWVWLLGDFLSTQSPDPETQLDNIRHLVANTARSVTNLLRQCNTLLGRRDAAAIVKGSVITSQAYVQVRWVWMTPLAAQLILTGAFLIFTVSATRRARMQVVKCSSLALLYALDEPTRQCVGSIKDLESMTQMARMAGVRLERSTSQMALSMVEDEKDECVTGHYE